MTSHNATSNAHGVMWKWIGWQRQRRTSYRVQYHNVPWCSIYECCARKFKKANILHCHLVHNKNTSPPTILEMYVSLARFDRDMFRSKYPRRVRHWSFSMLCRWRHWGRGIHLLPLQRYTRETSLSTWLPMPVLNYATNFQSDWYPVTVAVIASSVACCTTTITLCRGLYVWGSYPGWKIVYQ